MVVKYYFFIGLFLFGSIPLFSQNENTIKAPVLIEEMVNSQVVFRVTWNNRDNKDLKITWKSEISEAKFDTQEGEFYWQTSKEDVGLYKAFFYLKDSTGNIVEEAQTIIKIKEAKSVPYFQMIPDSLNTRPYVKLLLGERYRLEFVANSANFGSANMLVSYILDDDTDLRKFDQNEIQIVGNRILFDWTPTQAQANRKYFEMELIAIDAANNVGRRKYRFQIIEQNLPPRLKGNVNDTYIITADQELEIDFSVIDPNNDPVSYRVEIPISLGNPRISESGKFIWKLSASEMANIASVFPLNVKLIAQDTDHSEDFVEKEITIMKSDRNDPPVITKLSNLSIREGYAIRRRVFVRDNNHEMSQLNFDLDNEPEWLYLQQEGERLYLMSDTLGFDIVKADGISVQFDVLFSVSDPEGAADSEFFNVTVNQGVNTYEVYQDLDRYQRETDALLVGLRKKIRELDEKIHKNANLKRIFLFSTFALGTFSATGSFFDEKTIARQMIPYTGALLAISSSINALAFNQDGRIASLKYKLEDVEKTITRNKSYLNIYAVKSEDDDQLRNSELVNRVQSYRQSLIEQRIELEKLEFEYRDLNFMQRRIRKFKRKGRVDELKWKFINLN